MRISHPTGKALEMRSRRSLGQARELGSEDAKRPADEVVRFVKSVPVVFAFAVPDGFNGWLDKHMALVELM